MRRTRSASDWLWLLAMVIVYVGLAVMISILIAGAHAAPKVICQPPDPKAAPVISLARGEIRDLAALAWAEARGEADPYCAMQAVAAVVVNRMRRNPRYFGATITQVMSKPYAFSPFGRDDPQNRRMRSVDERDSLYFSALLATLAAVSGADPTRDRAGDGATYFYSGRAPDWSHRMLVTARIGSHTFLREP